MRIAAITMVRNERHYLPLWLAHYGHHLGRTNLYVIDHASNDGSTDKIDASVIRLPENGLDEYDRSLSVSHLHASLLPYYDAVIYADVDEFLVADPNVAPDLISLFEAANRSIISGIGVDVLHIREDEAALELQRPIFTQRSWARFSPYYCKPCFSKEALKWNPGFHSVDRPFVMHQGLFMFHLRSADWNIFCERQGWRNATPLFGRTAEEGISNHFGMKAKEAAALFFFDNHNSVREDDIGEFGFRPHAYEWFTQRNVKTPRQWPTARIPPRFRDTIRP